LTLGSDRRAPQARGSVGSRMTGRRPMKRLVGEAKRTAKPIVATRSRVGLGPSRDEKRRESRGIAAVAWTSLFIFVLLSGALLALQSWSFLSGGKPDASVPDVVGMKYEDAALAVEQAGLKLRIRAEAYSDDTEADIVMDQLPGKGAKVKAGREVLVDVSKGSRNLTTPNVIGINRDEAVSVLDNLGVSHTFLTPRYSDVADVGTVINQSPPPGAPIALGEAVELVASAGPLTDSVEMPQLEGLPYNEALQLVKENKLSLRRVSRTYVPGATGVVVTSQYPLAGSKIRQGSEVHLTLAAPTSQETTGNRSAKVVVTVPQAAGTVKVQITVQDKYETKEVYSQVLTGPTTVEQLVTGYGRMTVRVNFDNRNIREETF